jgi:molecular chaperone DnaK (HSP70)
VIIPKNSPFPTSKKDVFTTTQDGQKYIKVSVYEGENDIASSNRKIMDLELGPLDNEKAGVPKIEVTFDIGVNNVLNVNARQLKVETGVEAEARKTIPKDRPLKEKLQFWLTKSHKVQEKSRHTVPGKKLQQISLGSPYANLDPKIKGRIKELLNPGIKESSYRDN